VRRALVLALATTLALVGCGGEAKRLSREEYAQKADAICAEGNRQTERLPSPGNLPELADVTDRTLVILDDALSDLRKLKPPADQQKIVDQWLAQLETLTDDLEEIRDEARDNDIRAVQAIAERAQDHNARANELGTTLGMKVCNTTN
jgi:DNA-binding NtrC family response regulator